MILENETNDEITKIALSVKYRKMETKGKYIK